MTPIGILLTAAGYAVGYYGVSMWRFYTTTSVAHFRASGLPPEGIPLKVLLGLPGALQSVAKGAEQHSTPPFNLGGSIYGTTAHTTALQSANAAPPTSGTVML